MTTRFDLDGGAVGFVESSSAVPLVSLVVSVRSGALADPEGKDGVCRFAARMLRRGADGMTAQEIEATIDRLGAELALDVGGKLRQTAVKLGGALLGAARLIVRSDYNMFKIIFLFGRTKAGATNKMVWGGSSYSPRPIAGVRRKGFNRV
ncbi:MAG: hypothetical protein J0I07_38205 [Myxococcales bacterium]|nr:hypothetical protein [Myxococcales bacterium]